jgi:hypothetical protein
MEIAGYNIPDQYLLGGVGILVVGGFLLTRKPSSTGEIATLQPAEGLTWQDIIGRSDDGKLIGPGGPIGDSGPPGPLTPPPDINPPPPVTGRTPTPAASTRECRKDRDCGQGKKCKNGRCQGDGKRQNNRGRQHGNSGNNRPSMGSGNNTSTRNNATDPRINNARDKRQQNESRNRIDNNKSKRIDSTPNNRNNGRVNANPVSGSVKHPDKQRSNRDRQNNNRAHAKADAGTVKTGNIDKGTKLHISANAGKATASSKGKNNQKQRGRGRAGYGAVPGLESDGYGRMDGRGGDAEGYIRTNISPGNTTGGFMATPQPITGVNATKTLRKGESLKGLAQRSYGLTSFWPRLVTLNNDVMLPEGEIPAGTRFRV